MKAKLENLNNNNNNNSLLILCRQLYRHDYIWQHKNRIQTIHFSVNTTSHDSLSCKNKILTSVNTYTY